MSQPSPAVAVTPPNKFKQVWNAVWVAATSSKARKLETALIVVVLDAAAKALGIKV